MAAATLSPCLGLPCRFKSLSLAGGSSSFQLNAAITFRPLSFSANTSLNLFSTGLVSLSPIRRQLGGSIVCEAAPKKKLDSAVKRARQAEKRRAYNRARKSEVGTRLRKVLKKLDVLRKKKDAQPEEIDGIEKLIGEAYSSIDKAVRKGILHRNTGARRKSRLARRKKAILIHHGWYTPAAEATA